MLANSNIRTLSRVAAVIGDDRGVVGAGNLIRLPAGGLRPVTAGGIGPDQRGSTRCAAHSQSQAENGAGKQAEWFIHGIWLRL